MELTNFVFSVLIKIDLLNETVDLWMFISEILQIIILLLLIREDGTLDFKEIQREFWMRKLTENWVWEGNGRELFLLMLEFTIKDWEGWVSGDLRWGFRYEDLFINKSKDIECLEIIRVIIYEWTNTIYYFIYNIILEISENFICFAF